LGGVPLGLYLRGIWAAKRERALSELVLRLTAQLQLTTEERVGAERRARENHDTIASVLQQRDQWSKLYDEQSIAHGNAQAIMMDAIAFLERKLAAAGVNVTLPPIVRETQALYLDRHVTPVLERSGPPSDNQVESSPPKVGNV